MALITTGQAARIAGVTRQTIQNHIHQGKLVAAAKTLGGHFRLEEQEVRGKLCKPDPVAAMLD